jgi:two-component system LytT family response regulator
MDAESFGMANGFSPQLPENRRGGGLTEGSLFAPGDPSQFLAVAQELLHAPSVSFFVIANQRAASELMENLASAQGVALRGHAQSLAHADEKIGRNPPEVLILEQTIAASNADGLDRYLKSWNEPALVFLLNTPSDALQAYRMHALDCLVSPIQRDTLIRSLGHVLEHVRLRRAGQLGEKLVELFRGVSGPVPGMGRIPIRSNGRISLLRAEEIDWLEAQGDYVCLHCGVKKHLVRNKISTMALQLGPPAFVRIHRSIIVNVDRIRELQPLLYGEYAVILTDGTRLTLSRSYRHKAFDLITQGRTA